MDRRPSTQDITWLLDLNRTKQLDLNPPYQRRSVWTRKDRQFFLDTIFRNYPSPALFLHKSVSDVGVAKYHVVDGKQRLETILAFVDNRLSVAQDFGDDRIDGKKWKDVPADFRHVFWNYQVPVEMIDVREGELVRNVFDRLNRNSRKLTPQELRHAKFEGWFISRAENEAEKVMFWQDIGISTRARSSRMIDVQFISELMAVVIDKSTSGFAQEHLDELYANYEDVDDLEDFSEEDFDENFERAKLILSEMESHGEVVTRWAKGFGHFYSLWSVVALSTGDQDSQLMAERYASFMQKVAILAELNAGEPIPEGDEFQLAAKYLAGATGASTEPFQRAARYEALKSAVIRA